MTPQLFADAANKHTGEERKISVRQAEAILAGLRADPKLARAVVDHLNDHHAFGLEAPETK